MVASQSPSICTKTTYNASQSPSICTKTSYNASQSPSKRHCLNESDKYNVYFLFHLMPGVPTTMLEIFSYDLL